VKTPLERLSTRTATHFQHLPKGATPQVFDDLIVCHGNFTTALIRAASCRHKLRTDFRLKSKGVTCKYGFTRNSSRRRLHFQIAQFFEARIADTNLRCGVNFGNLGTKPSTIKREIMMEKQHAQSLFCWSSRRRKPSSSSGSGGGEYPAART
jgi:hypothetical protein